MIIDVHSHVPSHVDTVPPEEEMWENKMRPDRAVRLTTTYDDFFEAMKVVDRGISCGIAMPADRPAVIGNKKDMKTVNDATAALVARAPEKVIGFMSVHPDEPSALDEMERA